jgi:hypothetical protein
MYPRKDGKSLPVKDSSRPSKHCPFLKQTCLEGGCELWGSMKFSSPGQLAGTIVMGEMQACVFHLIHFGITHPAAPITFGPRG